MLFSLGIFLSRLCYQWRKHRLYRRLRHHLFETFPPFFHLVTKWQKYPHTLNALFYNFYVYFFSGICLVVILILVCTVPPYIHLGKY